MADADNQQESNPATQATESKFSSEYVRELREEAKGWRLKAQEVESAKTAAEAAAEKARLEATETVSKATQSANDRVIRAELKAVALKAGMIDLDGLKLADLSKVSLSDSGDVQGAEEMLVALKEAKPYLFTAPAASSSQSATPPKPAAATDKKASDMTVEEYAVARRKIGGR